jgi:uncharacterized protein YecE (DUF72 family)
LPHEHRAIGHFGLGGMYLAGRLLSRRTAATSRTRIASAAFATIEINARLFVCRRPKVTPHGMAATPEEFVFSVKGRATSRTFCDWKNVTRPLGEPSFRFRQFSNLKQKLGPHSLAVPGPRCITSKEQLFADFFELSCRKDTAAALRLARRREFRAWHGRSCLRSDAARPLAPTRSKSAITSFRD